MVYILSSFPRAGREDIPGIPDIQDTVRVSDRAQAVDREDTLQLAVRREEVSVPEQGLESVRVQAPVSVSEA
jgi:hypothetical protein